MIAHPQQRYEIGMVGLGIMGRSLSPIMADHDVAGFHKDTTTLVGRSAKKGKTHESTHHPARRFQGAGRAQSFPGNEYGMRGRACGPQATAAGGRTHPD